jgi:hypothetical protein
MGLQVVQVFRFAAVDVSRDVQIVFVRRIGDLADRHHPRVARQLDLLVEHVHDLVDVLGPQTVLVAVFHALLAGVDHEDARPHVGVFFVDHHDAGRDAGAVEQVGRQPDDALDQAAGDQVPADVGLLVAAEQHAVRHDHRRLALALQRGDDMQQESVVAVLGGRHAVLETAELVGIRIEPAGPCLGGEGRISQGKVEDLQAAVRVLEIRCGQRVATPQIGGRMAVQDHVHACQCPGGIVHFLPVDRQAARRFVRSFQQQRARSVRRIVDRLVLPRLGTDAHHLGQDAGDFGGRVELALALARFRGEMPHQVLVGVAQQIIAFGPVGAEVEPVEDRHQLR